jgi:hypothetical protein
MRWSGAPIGTPMTQPSLFDADTVPSPICCVEGRCPRQGRAVPHASGVNRDVTCLTCGRTGVQSTNTEARA